MAGRRTPISGRSISGETKKAFAIEGMREALDNLAKVMNAVSAREAKEVMYDAGSIIYREIVKNAPVDDGDLKNAVFVGRGQESKPNVLLGIGYGKGPHAHLVEYGTEKRHHKSGKYVGYVNANPFVRRSIDATAEQVKRRLIDGLRSVVLRHTKP